jgi:hypothetical protein
MDTKRGLVTCAKALGLLLPVAAVVQSFGGASGIAGAPNLSGLGSGPDDGVEVRGEHYAKEMVTPTNAPLIGDLIGHDEYEMTLRVGALGSQESFFNWWSICHLAGYFHLSSKVIALCADVMLIPTRQAIGQPSVPPAGSANNTARNKRDKNGDTLPPLEQSETNGDIELVMRIRREINKDNALSVTAKNIKIITIGGHVTLRGTVPTE